MAETFQIDKKKIFKNTLLLYIRMACMLLVGFYLIRLLLNELGVTDFGIYNTVFGLAGIFVFFRGAMSVTVQRFLCHEIGKSQTENAGTVFGASIFLFLVFAVFVLIAAETVGLWFVVYKLNIPSDRASAAMIAYQFSVFMMLFKLLQIPYIAVITSYENMSVYSWFSIFEYLFYLLSVFAIKFVTGDKLVYYTAFYAASDLIILIFYAAYCYKKYEVCQWKICIEKNVIKSIFSFFSWNLFGAVANISKQQGLNVLLNIFCGVVYNATWGIATQVGNAVNQFITSFQQAFNPQILKSYTNPDKKPFLDLLQKTSKYSFMLIWLVALPVLLQTEFLLKLWLGAKLPDEAVIFTQWVIIFFLFDAICGPMWVAVQATGNIRKYQVQVSCLIGMSFVFSLLALKLGAQPYSVAVINAGVNGLTLIYRLFYLRREIHFRVIQYCIKALLPICLVSAVTMLCGSYLKKICSDSWQSAITYLALITVINMIVIFLMGLSRQERNSFNAYLKRRFFHA